MSKRIPGIEAAHGAPRTFDAERARREGLEGVADPDLETAAATIARLRSALGGMTSALVALRARLDEHSGVATSHAVAAYADQIGEQLDAVLAGSSVPVGPASDFAIAAGRLAELYRVAAYPGHPGDGIHVTREELAALLDAYSVGVAT